MSDYKMADDRLQDGGWLTSPRWLAAASCAATLPPRTPVDAAAVEASRMPVATVAETFGGAMLMTRWHRAILACRQHRLLHIGY